jgi:hypothetical protein
MRKKYPSQIRYEENNPTITFRITKAEKELIEVLAKDAGKSISTLVRMALLDVQKEFTEALCEMWDKGEDDGFDKGNKWGYQKAKQEYEITYPCSICGELISFKPNSDCHKDVMQFLKENGWRHSACVNK